MKSIHFSIDDVGRSLGWLTANRPQSIWHMRLFSKLREWHERFGLITTLYCFTNEYGFNIADMPGEYAGELKSCATWLRFGYHGNSDTPFAEERDYEAGFYLFRSAMERLGAGGTDTLRLHNWLATGDQKRFLAKEGVRALLYPDDDAFPYDERDCFLDGGIMHKRTRVRFDSIQDADMKTLHLNRREVCAFAHEWCFEENAGKIERSIRLYRDMGFEFTA